MNKMLTEIRSALFLKDFKLIEELNNHNKGNFFFLSYLFINISNQNNLSFF